MSVEMGVAGRERTGVKLFEIPEGTISFELVPLGEGLGRLFPKVAPRNLKLSEDSAEKLGQMLSSLPYSELLMQDTRKRLLAKALAPVGWNVSRALEPAMKESCTLIGPHDIPLEEGLRDEAGRKLDVRGTEHMNGICIEVDGRNAWAVYTDEGDIARIVSEGPRRQGFFVASSPEDLFETADSLVRFLALARKRWAVFSLNMGRFVRKFHPMDMWRMVLDTPTPYQHTGVALSRHNKKQLIRLFSDYYDENPFQARLRLSRFRSDPRFSFFLIDEGFVIVRLDGETGLIYDIYVTPSKQGQGLGGELMRCALTSLSGRASTVVLHTSFPRAKTLYEKFGFRTTYQQLGVVLDEMRFLPPGAG